MKRNTNIRCCLQLFVILTGTFLISFPLIAQKRAPQNVRRVSVTCQYVLENGQRTEKNWPVYQQLYDSLGRLHTEIAFDVTDHLPHNYIWHTFKGKLMVKTEYFKDEKLHSIEEYTYGSDTLLTGKVLKTVNPADTSILYTLVYKYDTKGNPVEITAKTAQGKMVYVSKSTYNIKGKELTRIVKVKKNFFPQDSILKLKSIPVYDSIGRLKNDQITINKADKKVVKRNLKYSYDLSNRLIGLIEYDEKGKQVQREEREYQQNKSRVAQVKYYDSNDILVRMTGTRYEIYSTDNPRERVLEE